MKRILFFAYGSASFPTAKGALWGSFQPRYRKVPRRH